MIHRDSAPLQIKKRAASSAKSMGTFAPAYLKAAVERKVDPAAEAAFGEKKWVWVKDAKAGFLKAWITQEEDDDKLHVRCADDTDRIVNRNDTDKVNPPKFDGIQDMASLTYLNEPSVAHNLHQRYDDGMIYTYSGLFLVAVNPYRPLPLYNNDSIEYFRHRKQDEVARPHVFGTSDLAFRNMLEMRQNQSILVTGESGAGKTENTKRVIQYLAAIASKSIGSQGSRGNLEEQIIQANPILESFGNAQTVRNDNSSRFGKFIRIQFSEQGEITGAHINWFLLEKSRVVTQTSKERNYHVFYQLLAGAGREMRQELLLDGTYKDYAYLKHSRGALPGVSDKDMFEELTHSFDVMQFSKEEQLHFFRVIAAILLIGNIELAADRADQARLVDPSQVEKACHLLGIPAKDFTKALLTPRVKAGREWVTSARSASQVKSSLAALARSLYERNFGALVDRINESTARREAKTASFIGVLDMAGFEIFDKNSFEQLCINFTNEKLQQFFNHHMFVLEQEEYAREQIEWKFIDFGLDLQPTIELIEKSNPIGILSCLDEESVMPKATDITFTEKLHALWKDRSNKYRPARFPKDGFVLQHYAADVEYSTEGWLEKNKDPLNENVTQLLSQSSIHHVAQLFADSDLGDNSRVKKGMFRTVAQRHKEQLSSLMTQLHSTQPHFIRCILPNHEKSPRRFDFALVLDQLRCNGVLEGIRIARTGFPNRLEFLEFKQRYSLLAQTLPKGYIEGHKAAQLILDAIDMDKAYYRIGLTKVFFRAGVLAELEEKRDALLRAITIRVQAIAIGYLRRRLIHKRLHRKDATNLLKHDFKKYAELSQSPWWQLFMKMKPVLSATKSDREMKLRSAEIMKLEALAKARDEASREAVEKMNRAEAARQTLEEVLLAERSTASDKEELFKRSCEREALLREDLDLALADVDTLETRCDDLLSMKKELEAQIDLLRGNVDQGSIIAERLQREKAELSRHIEDVEAKMNSNSLREAEITAAQTANDKELVALRQQLSASEAQLTQLRSSHESLQVEHEKSIKFLEAKAANLQKQLDKVLIEKQAARSQLDEMVSSTSTNALLIRKKDHELTELKNRLSLHLSEDSQIKLSNSNLKIEVSSLKSSISTLQEEVASLTAAKTSLEDELTNLRTGATSSEAQQALETQMESLRSQLEAVQSEKSKLAAQSRIDVDSKHREAETHRMKVQKLEVINGDLVKQIAKAMQEGMQLKQELQHISTIHASLKSDRDALKLRLSKTESESDTVDTVRVELQKQLTDAQNRAKEAIAKASQVDVEKERFRREAMDMKAKFDELLLQRKNGEGVSKKYEAELAIARNKLKVLSADHDAVKIELYKSRAKLDHVNRLDEDLVATQVRDVTKQKEALETQLNGVRADKARIESELLDLKMHKGRFTKEMEDLNHELDREHQIAKVAESTTSQLQRSLAESRTNLELEREKTATHTALMRKLQANLDVVTSDLTERTDQVLSLYRAVAGEEAITINAPKDLSQEKIKKSVDLAKELADARLALKKAEATKSMLESQLSETKSRHKEITDFDSKHAMYKLRSDSISTLDVRTPTRPMTAPWTPPQINRATFESPGRSRTNTLAQNFENRAPSSPEISKVDASASKVRTLQIEVEQLQRQLATLQAQNAPKASKDLATSEQNSSLTIGRLTRENKRLHEMLEENTNHVDALEHSQRQEKESLRQMQSKSMTEVETTLKALTDDKIALTRAQHKSLAELENARSDLEALKKSKSSLQKELADVHKALEEQIQASSTRSTIVTQLEDEVADAQMKAESETLRAQELSESVKMYRQRAEEYFDRLEAAESTVIRATHSESSAKRQLQDAEEALQAALRDRQNQDSFIQKVQKQLYELEAKLEDGQLELTNVNTQKSRLQQELEQYRAVKSQELEERDSAAEQTRKAYQRELVSLSSELELERDQAVKLREDNRSIRSEIEELRSRRTEEQLNAATWEKEASRKEHKLQDLLKDLQASESAQRESQSRTVAMLSEIRELRVAKEELAMEREELAKQKTSLETKLRSLNDTQAATLQRMPSTTSSRRELATKLAEKEDLIQAMAEKVHLADTAAATSQREVLQEREANVQLHKAKVALENEKKELQLRMVDLETKSYASAPNDVKFLRSRIAELEKELSGQDRAKMEESRMSRNTDRTIKDLEAAIAQREVNKQRLEDKITKAESRTQTLQNDLETLRDLDAANQLRARKAEREASDQRERALRAEKELERYRNRDELNKMSRSNTINRLNGAISSLKTDSPLSMRSTYAPVR